MQLFSKNFRKLQNNLPILMILLFVVDFWGCEHSLEPLRNQQKPKPPSEATLVFSKHVLPIFQKNCAFNGCHGEQNAQVGLQLLSWESIVQGSDAGEVIIPFAPQQSLLIEMVSGIGQPRMPFNSPPLDSTTIDTLRQWISEGAPKDDGTIPYSHPGPRLFVPNRGDGWISIIDPAFQTVGRIVSLNNGGIKNPRPTAIAANAEHWFVAVRGASEIWQYDRERNEMLAKAELDGQPSHLILVGGKLYVAVDSTNGKVSNQVAIIDAETMQTLKTITVQREPVALAAAADGSLVFVANRGADWISVIDPRSDTVVRGFPLVESGEPDGPAMYEPISLALSSDAATLWVGCKRISQVRAYDASDGRLLAEISVRPFPGQIALSADGSKLYVPNQDSDRLTIIDTAAMQIKKVATFFGLAAPIGCAVSADGKRIYVSNSNANGKYFPRRVAGRRGNVAILDAETDQLLKVLEVEEMPGWLTVSQ
ncbi:MAG: hypothetical protein D6814_12105 [Calditrichaeota bacterium]|nr:MAG: hypothetical protein D6814_12105 [Calditrichota bacterium]